MYDFDFRVFAQHADAFWYGLGTTLLLAFGASIAGTVAGLPLGAVLRLPAFAWMRVLNDTVRAIPVLVLMLLAYYAPYTALGLPPVSRCGGAFFGLLAAQAVYTADLFRSAVDGVSQQTALAARALGLKRHEVWRYIILPDVLRTMFPTLVAFTIGNIHLSSLGAAVGCQEVMWVAMTTGENTFRAFEALLIVAAIYMVIVVSFGLGARWLERRDWLRRHG